MNTGLTLIFSTLALVSAGCTRSNDMVIQVRPPRANDAVLEVLSSPPADRPRDELAILRHDARNEQGALAYFQKRGREIGGDAIILGAISNTGHERVLILFHHSFPEQQASVVVWKKGAAAP